MSAHVSSPYQQTEQTHQLDVSEHHDWGELEHLRPSWSTLLETVPGMSIFVTPEWLFSWWGAYGADKRLCVLAFTDTQAGLVGIAPLCREQRKSPPFGKIQVLQLMGDGSQDTDDLDFIVKPGYAPRVAEAFLSWLRRTPWDVCELNYVSGQSEVVSLVKDELPAMGWKSKSSYRPVTRVMLPETWEQYLKQLSSHERGKVGNRHRRLETRHQLCFRRCESSDELPAFLETLFSLHQKRWESKGEPGVFSVDARRSFYGEMALSLLRRGWLELWQMEMDGVAVAAQIGLRYRSSLYSLQEGFDPTHATDSVGYVLRSYVLRKSIESGIRTYDFLYGNQDAKTRWGSDMGQYIDIHFARPGSLGALHIAKEQAVRAGKDWLRERLPTQVWSSLQALRHSRGEPRVNTAETKVQAME
jgi:CelD/BcsL family acetyltransferase involved in cellulose biosynthesis